MVSKLVAALALVSLVAVAHAAGGPHTVFTTTDGSVLADSPVASATVEGYSVDAATSIESVAIEFAYGVSTAVAGYTARCAIRAVPFGPSHRVDWKATVCKPPGIDKPPPLGPVLVTAYAVGIDGTVENPPASITVYVI